MKLKTDIFNKTKNLFLQLFTLQDFLRTTFMLEGNIRLIMLNFK